MNYSSLPLPDGISPVKTAAFLVFTEGPAVAADGTLYYSDIPNNRILTLATNGTTSVWRDKSNRTNGQTFDQEGRLLHCEGAEFGHELGARRITRTNLATGEYQVLTDQYDGQRYNSPNDICVDGNGRIYFTDPCYDDRSIMEMDCDAVYRIDPNGAVTRILTQPAIQRPNGIAVTQDSKHLYLVDSCPIAGGNRKIWHFDLDDHGNPTNQKVIWDFAPGRGGDGMRLDIEGNLYIAAGINTSRGSHEATTVPPGIYVISPQGEMKGRIPIPEDTLTNLAFGGADGKTIYVTAGKSIFTTRVTVPGQVSFPKWQ
ncbi:MAG: gluconolactonase [Planctomycetaceae bacterium]|nr:gluconolactonase [Planctomycetaceae bacterium]|tara:strand:- start:575 stop:1516 length:942 start_codon:yes stop_codon:yes gene_type:complete